MSNSTTMNGKAWVEVKKEKKAWGRIPGIHK
jgi:hypothetical protein